jgi:hypothetical protein
MDLTVFDNLIRNILLKSNSSFKIPLINQGPNPQLYHF